MRLLLLLLPATLLAADIWPQFRGPERSGVAPGKAWPESFAGLKPLWRVDLDKGFPGPVVSEDKVFVAETANTDTEVVRALDRKTGKEIWRASWPGKISVPFYAKRSGDWIRATPSFDGETLYVAGMEEVLVALDAKTGRERWRVDFPKRFGTAKPEFGFASSPLVDGEAIFVQAANSFVKLNKRTGATVWRILPVAGGVMESGAFSSPALAMLAGRRQVLVQARVHLHGVDPETGEVLWTQEVPNYRGMNILMPTTFGDTVFTSTHRIDSFAYQVSKAGVKPLWTNKAKGYMSTPVILDGYAYLHLTNQRFTCINLRNGETTWTTEPFGQYWSMAVRNGKILALDEGGKLLLIRANPEKFELLDSKEIANTTTWGHIAVAGDEIFVRELSGVAAYRWN
jgi:outer membrane protein assembly factor BamB